MKENKQTNKRKLIKQFVIMAGVAVLTVGIIYGLEALSSPSQNLPQRFQSEYTQAAESGQKVISLTNSVNQKVEQINNLDLEGQSQQSLQLIQSAIEENNQARQEAQKLSSSLEEIKIMLESLRGSEKARIVMEAIDIESQLVNEFMVYNEELDIFLTSLSEAIETNSVSDRVSVQKKLDSLNTQKQQINSLNDQFLSKLEELNQID